VEQATLTAFERLTLANQYKILEKVDSENEKQYSTLRKILEGGITFCYDRVFEDISEELGSEKSYFVVNVVNMFLALQYSFEQLEDNKGLEEADLLFRGFDKQDDDEWRFLECWRETWKHGFKLIKLDTDRSHGLPAERYAKMLKRWNVITGKYKDGYKLTKEHIKAIIGDDNVPAE
jgi:uncharacterized protein